jgi:hypothetical protein
MTPTLPGAGKPDDQLPIAPLNAALPEKTHQELETYAFATDWPKANAPVAERLDGIRAGTVSGADAILSHQGDANAIDSPNEAAEAPIEFNTHLELKAESDADDEAVPFADEFGDADLERELNDVVDGVQGTADEVRAHLRNPETHPMDFEKALRESLDGSETEDGAVLQICALIKPYIVFLSGKKGLSRLSDAPTLQDLRKRLNECQQFPFFVIVPESSPEHRCWNEIVKQLERLLDEVSASAQKPLFFAVSSEKLFAGKSHKSPILSYRKRREKGAVVPIIDRTSRFAAGGVVGYGVTEGAYALLGDSINGALAYGGNFASNFVAPLATPLLGTATMLMRRGVARLRYKATIEAAYDAELRDLAVKGSSASLEDLKRDIADYPVQNRSYIDTQREKDLIELMAKRARCAPAEVPYLGSEQNYTNYCFIRFKQTIDALKAQGKLNAPEQRLVDTFHIEVKDAETQNPEEKIAVLQNLHQVAYEYGRLLAYEHRKKRQAQMTGASLASAGVLSPLLGLAPLAVAALWEGGVRAYNRFQKPKGLEFDSKGKLRVTAEVAREARDDRGMLYSEDVFNREITQDDLTDDHKHWLKLIKLDSTVLNDPSIRTIEDLARSLQEASMRSLFGAKLPTPPKVPDEQLEKLRRVDQQETERLKEYESRVKTLESNKKKAEREIAAQRAIEDDDDSSKDSKSRARSRRQQFEAELGDIALDLTQAKQAIDGEGGQREKARKAREKLEKAEAPVLSNAKLRSSISELLIIDAYRETADQRSKKHEEKAAKAASIVQRLGIAETMKSASLDNILRQAQEDDASVGQEVATVEESFSRSQDALNVVQKRVTTLVTAVVRQSSSPKESKESIDSLETRQKVSEELSPFSSVDSDELFEEAPSGPRQTTSTENALERALNDQERCRIAVKEAETALTQSRHKKRQRESIVKDVQELIKIQKELKENESTDAKAEELKIEKLEKSFDTIKEAFAYKVKQEWAKRQEKTGGRLRGVLTSNAKEAARDSTSFVAGETAKAAVSAVPPVVAIGVATGTLYAVGAGPAVTLAASLVPGGLPTVFVAAGVYGAGKYIYNRSKEGGGLIANWLTKKLQAKPAPKAEEKKADTAEAKK